MGLTSLHGPSSVQALLDYERALQEASRLDAYACDKDVEVGLFREAMSLRVASIPAFFKTTCLSTNHLRVSFFEGFQWPSP